MNKFKFIREWLRANNRDPRIKNEYIAAEEAFECAREMGITDCDICGLRNELAIDSKGDCLTCHKRIVK